MHCEHKGPVVQAAVKMCAAQIVSVLKAALQPPAAPSAAAGSPPSHLRRIELAPPVDSQPSKYKWSANAAVLDSTAVFVRLRTCDGEWVRVRVTMVDTGCGFALIINSTLAARLPSPKWLDSGSTAHLADDSVKSIMVSATDMTISLSETDGTGEVLFHGPVAYIPGTGDEPELLLIGTPLLVAMSAQLSFGADRSGLTVACPNSYMAFFPFVPTRPRNAPARVPAWVLQAGAASSAPLPAEPAVWFSPVVDRVWARLKRLRGAPQLHELPDDPDGRLARCWRGPCRRSIRAASRRTPSRVPSLNSRAQISTGASTWPAPCAGTLAGRTTSSTRKSRRTATIPSAATSKAESNPPTSTCLG